MRLVIVSNRLPFTVDLSEGEPQFRDSSGGLVTGLWSYLERHNAGAAEPLEYIWMGWPGASVPPEQQSRVTEMGRAKYRAWPVYLSEESMERFYHGFCNKSIWPLFHYFPYLVKFEEEYWTEYRQVNLAFRDALLECLQPDDVVFVHDYQLMLLPKLIREKFPDMPIGFFLHIPFPSFEVFRLLPRAWRTEIMEGLLGASLVGFHTHDYTRHFLSCVVRTIGIEHHLGRILLPDRIVKVDTFPMGVDFAKYWDAASSPETLEEIDKLREKFTGQKVIFSVDRLDYTKGIINRLKGYQLFLERNPQWHGKIVFILVVAPSRVGVETYQAMKQEIDGLVGQIAGRYGQLGWVPLVYSYQSMSFSQLVSIYRFCDIAMITPLRDGMNLVAKEFMATRVNHTGVLILSEMAGASKEMGEAVVINPFHFPEITQGLEQALAMPEEEQIQRNRVMQDRLKRYDVNRWADDFLHTLIETQTTQAISKTQFLSRHTQPKLVQEYKNAQRRALLLDYDGTLVPFVGDPTQARPDEALIQILLALAEDPANQVVLVSGRSRHDLEQWFGHLPISIIAEHGVCLREPAGSWRQLRALTADWKHQIRPILQCYVDRLPGATLEEKEFSLAWHYRRSDPDQASYRAKELVDDLADFTRSIDVQVLEGNKVIEVRNSGITKGTATLEWLALYPADFILAIGDDWTDEDLFRVLPPSAHTIRVGIAHTAARFHLSSHASVRRLLRELADTRPAQLPCAI